MVSASSPPIVASPTRPAELTSETYGLWFAIGSRFATGGRMRRVLASPYAASTLASRELLERSRAAGSGGAAPRHRRAGSATLPLSMGGTSLLSGTTATFRGGRKNG